MYLSLSLSLSLSFLLVRSSILSTLIKCFKYIWSLCALQNQRSFTLSRWHCHILSCPQTLPEQLKLLAVQAITFSESYSYSLFSRFPVCMMVRRKPAHWNPKSVSFLPSFAIRRLDLPRPLLLLAKLSLASVIIDGDDSVSKRRR